MAHQLWFVDDNPSDLEMFTIAGDEVGLRVRTIDCSRDALNQLDEWRTQPERRPCMMIVDLNMPAVTGFDLLSFRQKHANALTFPAYVLSSSSNPGDIEKAKSLGADGYFVKPSTFAGLIDLMTHIKHSAHEHGCEET
ncbi:MAG: response regulator [Planctomycetes bacterium]|nr:response regulator [Planctomycetota bacterium]